MSVVQINNKTIAHPDWVKISNRSTWIVDKFEKINPANEFKYISYWKDVKQKCIEGMWGEDSGAYRYMTGNLYFYVNLCTMSHTDKANKRRYKIRPQLSDLEWELSYMFLEAKGFSGWSLDEEYTSSVYWKECIENGWEKLSDIPDRIMLNILGEVDNVFYREVFTKDGSRLKKYISPRENIRKLHLSPKGVPLYHNPAQNTVILGSRGGGKSYYLALAECLHTLVFDGTKYYNMEYINNPPKAQICIGSADTDKSSEFFHKIEDCLEDFATNEDLGAWGKPGDRDYQPNIFFKDMSGSTKPGNKSNPYKHSYKKSLNGRWVSGFGSGSTAFHVSYSAQKRGGAEAAAGGRYLLSVVEEAGLLSNLKEVHASNTYTVTLDGEQFGVQAFIGTSGDLDLVQPVKEMFNSPQDYNILAYSNIWENEDNKIGFFLPVEGVDRDFKDKNGNTRWEESLKFYADRKEKFKQLSNPEVLRKERLFYPSAPSDMWVDNTGKILPSEEAQARINYLEKGNLYKKLGTPIKLKWDPKTPTGVSYEVDYEATPFYEIRNISNRDSLAGCVMMYQAPNTINGEIPPDMYQFVGHDPYVSDNQDEGGSLGATHIILNPKYRSEGYDGGKVVATYIGKPLEGKEKYYENQEKLIAMYGNAYRCLWYEANRGQACRDYYLRKHKTNLLCIRPQRAKGDSAVLKKVTNYGWLTGNRIAKIQLLEMLRDWLLEPCVETFDENTGITTVHKRNIDQIDCLFTLKEIEAFDIDKGNYDAVMSLVGAVLGIREHEHIALEIAIKRSKRVNELSYISENTKLFNVDKEQFLRKKQLKKLRGFTEDDLKLPNPFRKGINN